MSRLPVIVGFGGVNSAGRSSFHHAYKRLIIDVLSAEDSYRTYLGNAAMMGAITSNGHQFFSSNGTLLTQNNTPSLLADQVNAGTLIRELNQDDLNAAPAYFCPTTQLLMQNNHSIEFILNKSSLPMPVPLGWVISAVNEETVKITVTDDLRVNIPLERTPSANMGGQLPSGFSPGALYKSGDKHPRALQMAVYAASDALGSVGIGWADIQSQVPADQVAVYASSLMGQMDDKSLRGMMQAWLRGRECTNKQVAFGLGHMPADFVNSYITGTVGSTGGHIGACSSFLYNLEHGIRDIQEGRCRVAIVGSAEAPLIPESIEGYCAAGAATTDNDLRRLDKQAASDKPNYRSACRPFNDNAGMVLGESSQYLVLFDDQLACELGAEIYGAVPAVYINADGFKKSIYAPGAGNYITFAKSVAMAEKILGSDSLRHRTFVHSHGTGTPLNRKTEAEVINKVAAAFHVDKWHVAAIKSYLGHSLGAAAGDQLVNTLGIWQYGVIPGIATLDHVAEDVDQTHLHLSQQHTQLTPSTMDSALINTKGFGGNNATALVLAPHIVERYLQQQQGSRAMSVYKRKRETVRENAQLYDDEMLHGVRDISYSFGENVIDEQKITINDKAINLPGLGEISLDLVNPYGPIN